jgi:hypothetical protein
MLKNLMKTISFSLSIKIKKTPNSNFLQFLPQSEIVMGGNDSIDILDECTASLASPLATKLFKINGIKRVFFGPNYISIGKTEQSVWDELNPLICQEIQNHYVAGWPILNDPTHLPRPNNEALQPSDS